MKQNKSNILLAVGFIALVIIVIEFFREINKETSTELYDNNALKDIEDDDIYKEIYGDSFDIDSEN